MTPINEALPGFLELLADVRDPYLLFLYVPSPVWITNVD